MILTVHFGLVSVMLLFAVPTTFSFFLAILCCVVIALKSATAATGNGQQATGHGQQGDQAAR